MTYIVGEAWCVLTSCKVHGKNCPPDAEQVPVASAAPSLVQGDLHLIGWLAHASILEEEICSALDVVEALQQKAEREGNLPVGEWLRDLRCVIVMAHFCLLHRPNRDSCFFSFQILKPGQRAILRMEKWGREIAEQDSPLSN